MSDPFLSSSDASAQHELHKLIKENRGLREENAKLKIQINSPSTIPSKLARLASSTSEEKSSQKKPDEVVPSKGPAEIKKYKQKIGELLKAKQAEEAQRKELEARLQILKNHFEAFVTETIEREEAYKIVHLNVFVELEAGRTRIDQLQHQLQEIRKSESFFHAKEFDEKEGENEPQQSKLKQPPSSDAVAAVLNELKMKIAELERADLSSSPNAGRTNHHGHPIRNRSGGPGRIPPAGRSRKRGVSPSRNSDVAPPSAEPRLEPRKDENAGQDNAEDGESRNDSAWASPTASPFLPVGAGALRGRAGERPRAPSASSKAASTTPKSRGRPRAAPPPAPPAPSLFAHFPAESRTSSVGAENAKSGPRTAALLAAPEVQFSANAIHDYVRLWRQTPNAQHREVLARKLLEHFAHHAKAPPTTTVVAEAISYFRQRYKAPSHAAQELLVLWEEVQGVVRIARGVCAGLADGITRLLIKELGRGAPPTPDLDARCAAIRALALTLRFLYTHRSHFPTSEAEGGKEKTEKGGVWQSPSSSFSSLTSSSALFFYEASLSVLQFWRCGRLADVENSEQGMINHNVDETSDGLAIFSPYFTLLQGLWGNDAAVREVFAYHNVQKAEGKKANGGGFPLPRSLASYAIQGVVPLCLLQLQSGGLKGENVHEEIANGENDRKNKKSQENDALRSWFRVCEAVGWGVGGEVPLNAIGEAAVRFVVENKEKEKELEGYIALRCLLLYKGVSYLQTLRESLQHHAPSSDGAGAERVFAKLISFAVLDLRLRDARDAQWWYTIAFLHEYLQGHGERTFNSAEELLASTNDACLLSVRAIFEVCQDPPCDHAAWREAITYISGAFHWIAAQEAALRCVQNKKGGMVGWHPLKDTTLGRVLIEMLSKLRESL